MTIILSKLPGIIFYPKDINENSLTQSINTGDWFMWKWGKNLYWNMQSGIA